MPAKHRKPRAKRKDDTLKIRLTTDQKTRFQTAADLAEIDLSNWARIHLIRHADEEIAAAAKKTAQAATSTEGQ